MRLCVSVLVVRGACSDGERCIYLVHVAHVLGVCGAYYIGHMQCGFWGHVAHILRNVEHEGTWNM